MNQVTTHVVHFDEEGFHEDILDQPFIPEELLKSKQKFLWVHLEGERDPAHLMPLFEELGLDTTHIHKIHDLNQRPKVEMYKEYAHWVSKFELLSQKTKRRYKRTSEKITLFFNESVVLTYHPSTRPIFTGIREALKEDPELRGKGTAYLAYTLLDTMIDAYQPSLENYEHYIDYLEDVVINHPSNKTFLAVHELKKQLGAAHTALMHFTQAVEDLIAEPPAYLNGHNLEHFMHLAELGHHSLDRVDGFKENVGGLIDLFFSSQGSKQNDLLKWLTIVSMVFVPTSFLTGVWGIQYYDSSIWNLFELKHGSGYWVVGGSCLLIIVLMLWYFKRKGWMDDDSPHLPSM